MKLTKKIYLILMFVCSFAPSLAYADKILDKVELIQAKTETEIHIEFLTQVRYIRHSPDKQTSRVQIFLEFPQYSNSALPTQREFRNSPSTNLVPSFTVNYPEQQPGSIGIRFKKPIKFTITPDNSGRGIVIHVPFDKNVVPVVAAPAQVEVVSQPEIEHGPQGEVTSRLEGMSDDDYARKLVAEARVARGVGDYPRAVQIFNVVLGLPVNSYSQEAQELIGNSREKMGESDKARAEYETYLKLYPKGEGADRVRQRLAVIGGPAKVVGIDAGKGKKPIAVIHENTVYGSWNQYYYSAHSRNYNSDPSTNNTTHDQSQLISSFDLTARFRHNEWDNKIVFRDTQTMNFLPDAEDRNRLQAAYVEVLNKESDYLARLGRQNGNSGGVLGRFDGALFRYGFTPKYKLNFVLGTLNEYKVDYRRPFYGINLDVGPVFQNWSGNAYYINQRVGDLKDREAVGTEVRYFNGGKSIYTLVDYDIYFDRVNTAMLQGNWLTTDGTNFNMLVEQRKSPVLQLINSLSDPIFSSGLAPYLTTPTSLSDALRIGQPSGLTVADLRESAIKQTLDTELFLFGATRQFTPRWQLGADIQMSRVSGSPGATAGAIALAKKAASDAGTFLDPLSLQNLNNAFSGGNTYTYHVQAVGLDTIFKDDTSIFSASLTDGPTSTVHSFIYTNVMVPREKWRLDSSFKFLKVDTDPSSIQYIVSPTMRASYRLREKATIEAEIGLEVTNVNDSLNGHSRTFRDFSFIGYRLDI